MTRKLTLVALLGVVAIHVWGIGFSSAFYRLYLLSGSPEHPTPLQWYPTIVGLSFLFGFVGAFPSRFIAPHAGSSAAIAFVVAASLSFLASTVFFVGLPGVFAQLSSYGFWGFMLGSLVCFSTRRRVAT